MQIQAAADALRSPVEMRAAELLVALRLARLLPAAERSPALITPDLCDETEDAEVARPESKALPRRR